MGVCVTPGAMASAGIHAVRHRPVRIRLPRRLQVAHVALLRHDTIPVSSRPKTAHRTRSRDQISWGPPLPPIAGPASLHPLPVWSKQPW